jgi:hypothetical protein
MKKMVFALLLISVAPVVGLVYEDPSLPVAALEARRASNARIRAFWHKNRQPSEPLIPSPLDVPRPMVPEDNQNESNEQK